MRVGPLMTLTRRCATQLVFLTALLTNPGIGVQAGGSSGRVPVLLELFTSEGCSSCPPADRLLEEIDQKQPVAGAELIVLSEHVDYWNHLGWADPYSSPMFTARQQQYALRFGTEDTYTPELVVDGARSLVGSNWADAERAIEESLREPKSPLNLSAQRQGRSAHIRLEIGSDANKKAGLVYLVLAHDHARSRVARGENAGRELGHVAVAYCLRELGETNADSTFARDVSIPLRRDSSADDTRVIALIQKRDTGKIVGAAELRL